MKNVALTLMGIIIVVLAGFAGRTSERLRRASGPSGEMEQLKGYLELIERYSQITRDSTKTGAAAVIYSKELFKGAAPGVASAFYTELLTQTQDVAIQRAIRMELVDIYLHSAKPDKEKAMEQLKVLLIAGPTTLPSSLAEH